MKILITGGCGYKGSVIIPTLLNQGHEVVNFDTQWFGNYILEHKNFVNKKGDIRNIDYVKESIQLFI